MQSIKHLIVSISLSVVVMIFGTFGYMVIEDWAFLDALYMTIITVSTVGYSEVHRVGPVGRVFTIFLVVFGVGFTLYVAGAMVQFMVEGRVREILGRKRLSRKIDRLKDHYIVCGYGRIGRVLSRQLQHMPVDVIVIESNPELVPVMESDGVLFIHGDASKEDNLVKARIGHARGLVAVLASDVDNVFLVLTMRQLSKTVPIIARAGQEGSKDKLLAAGATFVESPYEMGAIQMAQRIIRPTVTNFLDLALGSGSADIQMEAIPISAMSPLANVALKDSGIRQDYGLILVATKTPDGHMKFNPSFETLLEPGHTVIAVGEPMNLERLGSVLRRGDT